MKIKDLIRGIPCTWLAGDPETEVTGICHDNRKMRQGDAFICVAGARFDTHTLIGQIAEAGASLIVVEKDVPLPRGAAAVRVEDSRLACPLLAAAFYGHPAEKMKTVGITGSKGKTTTAHMAAQMLRCAGKTVGTIGTNGAIMPDRPERNEIPGADRKTCHPCGETPGSVVYELDNTTPDPIELQMYLAMMAKAGCTHAVIEVSSQAMKQHRVDGFIFDCGIWTNIEEGDHIGPNEHKDFAEYLRCKAGLINHSRIGFVNCDDPHLDAFLRYVNLSDGSDGRPKRLWYFGTSQKADFRLSGFRETFDENEKRPGIAFDVTLREPAGGEPAEGGEKAADAGDGGTRTEHLTAAFPGKFNMYNAAAAFCAADRMGVPVSAVNEGLNRLKIRGRFDIVFDNGHFRVCVDFAHNGYSTRNHLSALREYRPRRIVCVFSADGNRSVYRRTEMGEASALLADFSIVTEGHNRFETFEAICSDILKGIESAEKQMGHKACYWVIPNRETAIRYAIENAQEGDFITILGLGHESYQEENGKKYPHADIEYVRKVCAELGLENRV
ncbi:MAG: Mur ligase family protein [Lachnospiraceae bacterium]|jgi:UDP-N-acetylmuramoyl-L-alanyl-D-glutamate--2,6-diaminopimelate ligase